MAQRLYYSQGVLVGAMSRHRASEPRLSKPWGRCPAVPPGGLGAGFGKGKSGPWHPSASAARMYQTRGEMATHSGFVWGPLEPEWHLAGVWYGAPPKHCRCGVCWKTRQKRHRRYGGARRAGRRVIRIHSRGRNSYHRCGPGTPRTLHRPCAVWRWPSAIMHWQCPHQKFQLRVHVILTPHISHLRMCQDRFADLHEQHLYHGSGL